MELLSKLRARATVVLELDGSVVLDERSAKLLLLVDKRGSILAASKALGMPYSRAWEAIARIERLLGARIVESKRGGRGGGGARLTEAGRKLLDIYVEEYWRLLGKPLEAPEAGVEAPELVYAGSHDLLLERILGELRRKGYSHVEAAWIGSSGGLASLMLGEADVAGVHLYDPATGKYNEPFLDRYWLRDKVVLVRGYDRELGFAHRGGIQDPLAALLEGKARLINRCLGSGTRVYLDHLIERKAREMSIDPEEAKKRVKGYETEARTHIEVARAIALGEADVGLTTRWAAAQYGLEFTPVTWERFDYAVPLTRLDKASVKAFLEALKPENLEKLAAELPGYRVPRDAGSMIHDPRRG